MIIPWTSWLQTGDTTIIEQNWDAMTKYLDAIAAANPDFLWKNDYGQPFGDWLSPEGKTDEVLIATAYWAYDVTLMQQMAHATGRTATKRTNTRSCSRRFAPRFKSSLFTTTDSSPAQTTARRSSA